MSSATRMLDAVPQTIQHFALAGDVEHGADEPVRVRVPVPSFGIRCADALCQRTLHRRTMRNSSIPRPSALS
jgi:hypothetical protein